MVADWSILIVASYMLVPIPLYLVGLRGVECLVAQLAFPPAFLALCWWRGRSIGMAGTGLRMVRANGDQRPSLPRTLLRALMIYPGALSAGALAVIAYSVVFGTYPSGAEPGFDGLRILVLASLAGTYLAMMLFTVRRSDGAALHDLASGVRVLEFRAAPAPRTPRRLLSLSRPGRRWLLLGIPPLGAWGIFFVAVTGRLIYLGEYPEAAITLLLFVGPAIFLSSQALVFARRPADRIPPPTPAQ